MFGAVQHGVEPVVLVPGVVEGRLVLVVAGGQVVERALPDVVVSVVGQVGRRAGWIPVSRATRLRLERAGHGHRRRTRRVGRQRAGRRQQRRHQDGGDQHRAKPVRPHRRASLIPSGVLEAPAYDRRTCSVTLGSQVFRVPLSGGAGPGGRPAGDEAAHLCTGSALGHAAPAPAAVLRLVQEQVAASAAGLDPFERALGQQRRGGVNDRPAEPVEIPGPRPRPREAAGPARQVRVREGLRLVVAQARQRVRTVAAPRRRSTRRV